MNRGATKQQKIRFEGFHGHLTLFTGKDRSTEVAESLDTIRRL